MGNVIECKHLNTMRSLKIHKNSINKINRKSDKMKNDKEEKKKKYNYETDEYEDQNEYLQKLRSEFNWDTN